MIKKYEGQLLDGVSSRSMSGRNATGIELRPVESLRVNPRNPRTHSKKQIRKIANSIRRLGFTRGSDGQSDMCPLISVVGVTPEYYQKLPGNYRGRITHELNLGKASHSGALGDVATLRDRVGRIGFAARYLSAVRAGEKSLNAWREKRRTDHDLEPPNPCINCPVRDGCHETFGAQN